MTFRFTVKQNPLQIEFEAGSIAEAIGILTDSQTALGTIFAQIAGICGNTSDNSLPTVNDDPAGKKRGRPPLTEAEKAARAAAKGNPPALMTTAQNPPAPVTASAPAPLPIDTGIPSFLDRSQAVAPPPSAPPPPASPLADAVIANLKIRKGQTADNGAALVTWLASAGIVANGANFEEAVAVLQFTTADKLALIATALGVK